MKKGTHTFAIAAVNELNIESDKSPVTSVKALDKPAPPTRIVVK